MMSKDEEKAILNQIIVIKDQLIFRLQQGDREINRLNACKSCHTLSQQI